MQKLDRYLTGEFAQAIFATLVVLLIVCVGGAFTDVLEDIAKGKVPAGLMLVQLGLGDVRFFAGMGQSGDECRGHDIHHTLLC